MAVSVLLPKILSPGDFRPVATLHPLRLSVTVEQIPCSSAKMTLPDGESVAIREWLRLYTVDGDAGIFRVTALSPAYPGNATVTLSHGVCALGDDRIRGRGTLSGTLGQIVATLLPHQTAKADGSILFASGAFVDTPMVSVDYNNDTLLDVLKQACEQLHDYQLTIDQSATPWQLGCIQMDAVPTAEGRFARNMQGVSIDIDDDDMCTRLSVQRKTATGDLSYTAFDAETVNTYGVIEHVYEPPYNAAEADITDHVRRYLAEHCEPTVSITVDLLSLHTITGEPMDRLRRGKLMRCCMPEYGTTITNRIRALEYPDALGDPIAVRAHLRNKAKNASDIIHSVQQQAAQNSTNHTRTEYVLQETSFSLVRTYEEVTRLNEYTKTTFNEVGIWMDAVDPILELHTKSIQTIGDSQTQMETRLLLAEDALTTTVRKDNVISVINQTPEAVTIDAERVDLVGYVTASQLKAAIADIWAAQITFIDVASLAANDISTTFLSASSFTFSGTLMSKRSMTVSTPDGNKTIYYLGYAGGS